MGFTEMETFAQDLKDVWESEEWTWGQKNMFFGGKKGLADQRFQGRSMPTVLRGQKEGHGLDL